MTDEDADDSPRVTYGVKELLQDIRLSIERLDSKLDTKAEKADVAVLSQRVDTHGQRLDGHDFLLGEVDRNSKERMDSRRFRVPLVLSAAFNVISPFLWYAVYHVHY